MAGFRYAQYCPLARAAEILGERWTLLILRELTLGPRRFSDLKGPLPGVSTSVLSDRLARLEERDLVTQRALPPPTPAVLYELTGAGRALEPALVELGRWGMRYLGERQPTDHFEPAWVRLGLAFFARRGPSPRRRFAIELRDGERETRFQVSGGRRGTRLDDSAAEPDALLRVSSPFVLMGLASGGLDAAEALRSGQLELEGDRDALSDFPALFDVGPG